MAAITVREALTPRIVSIYQNATIREMLRLIAKTDHEWFRVFDGHEELVGVVTYKDVVKAVDEGRLEEQVLDHATRNAVCAFSDETLRDVLIRFNQGDLGYLPVVDPANPKRLIGIISRQHVIKAYSRALARRRPRSGTRR